MEQMTMCVKKRKRNYFCFLMHVFLFFKHFLRIYFIADLRRAKTIYIKNSRDSRITANVPLLNLNLNYEKLRHKDNKFYLLTNIYDSNFCIL